MLTAPRPGLFLACCALLLSGCSFGPTVIRGNLLRYNDAVTDTESKQFLLNLVRLKYRDPPKSLAIGSITASYSFDATAPSGFVVGRAPSVTDILAGTAHVADAPTISMTPLGGVDYVTGLVSPIPLNQVVTLAQTGWDLDRLLRLMVHNMNGLENVPNLAGKGSERPPRYVEFAYVAQALSELQHQGALELATHPAPVGIVDLSEPLPIKPKSEEKKTATTDTTKTAGDVLKAADLIKAADGHYLFHQTADGKLVLQATTTAFDMSLAPGAWQDPHLVESAQLLKLIPGQPTYRLLQLDGGQFKRKSEGVGLDIIVGTRSVLSTMLFMSRGVEVPLEHYQQGLVAAPLDEQGRPFDWTQVTQGLFRVCVQKHKPKHAFVSVKYRGYWFYIADNDLSSKSSFDLVIEMLQVQITRGLTSSPVLTVPVSAGRGGKGG